MNPSIRRFVNPSILLSLLTLLLGPSVALPVAQSAPSDLDAFMAGVLAARDGNWKKLQQYVLGERETLQMTGPAGVPLYGFRREYTWFPRDGVFVRSPLAVDGVAVSEADRRREEERWLRREERRERRRIEGTTANRAQDEAVPASGDRAAPPGVIAEATMREALEPGFVSAAYFLRFKFDPGHYALAGREQRDGREVLRIEYYPTRLFESGRTRPNRELREKDDQVGARMNKVSMVTLWIDRQERQIVEYDFQNVGMDFLPGRSLVRLDHLSASMRMAQPFPDTWLPATIAMQFGFTLAVGSVDARYDVRYDDYRLAAVTTNIR